MLDKGQIKDWDGGPEDPAAPKPEAKATETPRGGIPAAIFDSREAFYTGERVQLTPEQSKARKRRGQWIALALFAFVILLFVLTMTKIGGNVANWGTAFPDDDGKKPPVVHTLEPAR